MKRKNFFQRLSMPLPELEQYYREQRQTRFENNEPFHGIKFRKMLHPILVCGLKLMHLINGQKITIVGDKRVPTDRPLIFAATHIGWDDIETAENIKHVCYAKAVVQREHYRDFQRRY